MSSRTARVREDTTVGTIPDVALRDSMQVSNILRVTGDNAGDFSVTFRLYIQWRRATRIPREPVGPPLRLP